MRVKSTLFAAPLALLLSSTSVFAQSAEWTVSEVSGEVLVSDGQGQRTARRGTQIGAGGSIETGARSSATLVRDREFVTVQPNSRLSIPGAVQERSMVQVLQDWGSAIFNIGKEEDPHFAVETPYLTAVVKGTIFTITVTGSGASMQVTEGAVEVQTSDGGAVDLVESGAVAIVTAEDRFRLTVEDTQRRVTDSPNRAAIRTTEAGPVVGAVNSNQGGAATANSAGSGQAEGSNQQAITSTIIAGSGDLSEMSGGLVSGGTAEPALAVTVGPDAASNGASPSQSSAEQGQVIELAVVSNANSAAAAAAAPEVDGAEAPGASGDAPGNSGDAPGQQDDEGDEDAAPGNSGDAPGQQDDEGDEGDAPGNSGDAPGQQDDEGDEGDAPGNSGDAPGQQDDEGDEGDAPGNSGDAPGQQDDEGDEGDAPGNSGDAPGQQDDEGDEGDDDDAGSDNSGNGNGNGN